MTKDDYNYIVDELFELESLINGIGLQNLKIEVICEKFKNFLSRFIKYYSLEVYMMDDNDFVKVYEDRAEGDDKVSIEQEVVLWLLDNKDIGFYPYDVDNMVLLMPFRDSEKIFGYAIAVGKTEDMTINNIANRFIHILVYVLSLFFSRQKHIASKKSVQKDNVLVKNILENNILGFLIIDKKGNIKIINHNALTMLGLLNEPNELKEQNIFDYIFDTELYEKLYDFMLLSFKNGFMLDYEVSFGETKNKLVYSLSSTVFESDDEKVAFITINDITMLKEYYALKKVDKMKDNLIALITHELQTPVSIIKAYMETLAAEFGETDKINDMHKEFVNIVHTEVNKFSRLISNVIEFSELQKTNQIYDLESENLIELLNEIYEETSSNAENRHITYKTEYNDIKEAIVLINWDKIKIAIMNILENAFKYTSEKGNVIIRVSVPNILDLENEIDLTQLYADKKYYLIEIIDDGLGIDEENLDAIFEHFYQDEDIMYHHEGLGLGLPIAKQIIVLHNGYIWVKSQKGAGSNFRILLPAKE